MYKTLIPKMSQLASRDELRTSLTYIVAVEDEVFATNAHVLGRLPSTVFPTIEFAGDPFGWENFAVEYHDFAKVEGKKWTSITCDLEHARAMREISFTLTFTREPKRKGKTTAVEIKAHPVKDRQARLDASDPSDWTRFPDYNAVIPHDGHNYSCHASFREQYGVNAMLLADLQKMLASVDGVEMFTGVRILPGAHRSRGIMVAPADETTFHRWRDEKWVALLMPVLIN